MMNKWNMKKYFLFIFIFVVCRLFSQPDDWDNTYARPQFDERTLKHVESKLNSDTATTGKPIHLRVLIVDKDQLVNVQATSVFRVFARRKHIAFPGADCHPVHSSYTIIPGTNEISDTLKTIWKLSNVRNKDELFIVKNERDTMRLTIATVYVFASVYRPGVNMMINVPWTVSFKAADFSSSSYPPIHPRVSPQTGKLLKTIYADTSKFVSLNEYSYSLIASCGWVNCARSDKQTYSLKDTITLFATGTIMLTGGCGAYPMIGIQKFKNGEWISVREPSNAQMCCGMPYMDCTNAAFQLGSVKYLELDAGEYRIITVGQNRSRTMTNSFRVQ
jgi:hypothetical protein